MRDQGSSPAIDVLLATHNGERFVAEQILSVLAQTHVSLRVLVSDDCSCDNTLAIVDGIASADPRVEVVCRGRRHGSACANFMWLLRHTDADYVMPCDQDDVWLPHKVSTMLETMRAQERMTGVDTPTLVFSDMCVVDEDLEVLCASFERYSRIDASRTAFRHVLAQSVGSGNAMMANRALVRSVVRTPSAQPMIMHDWWMSLVAAAFGTIAHVDEATVLYRQHGANANGALRFSVGKRLSQPRDMWHRFALTVEQAASFEEVYGPSLSADDRATLRRYARIASEGTARRVLDLCASGAWKLGTRKAGQLFGALAWSRYGNGRPRAAAGR